MKNTLEIKTVAGVGVGVLVGYAFFKQTNPLVLMAFGVGGGILGHHIKTKKEQIQEAEQKEKERLNELEKEIQNSLFEGYNDSDKERISFNKKVGYMTPKGEVQESNPSDYMDVKF